MSRFAFFCAALWTLTLLPLEAQEFSGLARINPEESRVSDLGRDSVQIDLHLSQGVPYRVFTLDGPPRLVLDFQEVDWTGLVAEELDQSELVKQAQFGAYVPGWSRMVLELAGPMGVEMAALDIDDVAGAAHLAVLLSPASPEAFAEVSGAPYDERWDLPEPEHIKRPVARGEDAPLVVVLDPGHGGIDPGAEMGDVVEKELMLTFSRELREILLRSGGFQVVMTRETDNFVSLERRVSLAYQAGADVFLSLHADSLAEGLAHGATVYVLSKEASDVASAKLAERHDRHELLSGVDLSGSDDEITDVLLDLARQETQPRTDALARDLVNGMTNTGGPMNRRPMRSAAFSVLKAADIPSVLIEIGFLSSPRDLQNLRNPEWRLAIAQGIRNGLQNWREADAAKRDLVRK